MSVREYVGARYVPIVVGEWDSTRTYEPLMVVTNQGNSYTSRQYVPAGIEITNESYWVLSANYNAQVEQYRQDVKSFDGRITANANAIEAETTNRTAAVTAEKTRAEDAEHALQTNIDAEKNRATEQENAIKDFTGYSYNVTNFGADPTGELDSSDAINKAIKKAMDASKTNGIVSPVIFVPGIYKIASSINVPQYIALKSTGAVRIESYAPIALNMYVDDLNGSEMHSFWTDQSYPAIEGGFCLVSKAENSIGIKINGTNTITSNLNTWAWHEFYNLSIIGFDIGIKIVPKNVYLDTFYSLQFSGCNTCIDVNNEPIVNSGEMIKFISCVFGDCNNAVVNNGTNASFDFSFTDCSFDYVRDYCFTGSGPYELNVFVNNCHFEGMGKNIPTATEIGIASICKNLRGFACINNSNIFLLANTKLFSNAIVANTRITSNAKNIGYLGDNTVSFENTRQINSYFVAPSSYSDSLFLGDFSDLQLGTVITEGKTINDKLANKYVGSATIETIKNDNGNGINFSCTEGTYAVFEATLDIENGYFYFPFYLCELISGSFRGNVDISFMSASGAIINTIKGDYNYPSASYGGANNQHVVKPPKGAAKAKVSYIFNPTNACNVNIYDLGFYKC